MTDKPKRKQGRPAKRTITKSRKVTKALKIKAPEELESFWNDDVQEAWLAMRPKQQDFIKVYLTNGNNASDAYRKTYNGTELGRHVSAHAFQVLASISMQTILNNIAKGKAAIFLHCQNKLLDASEAMKPVFNPEGDSAMDVEDHPTRIKAVSELAKLSGFMIDKTDSTINITKNLTINHNVIGEMNQYLEKQGHKPIKQSNGTPVPQEVVNEVIEEDDGFEAIGDTSMRVLGS